MKLFFLVFVYHLQKIGLVLVKYVIFPRRKSAKCDISGEIVPHLNILRSM